MTVTQETRPEAAASESSRSLRPPGRSWRRWALPIASILLAAALWEIIPLVTSLPDGSFPSLAELFSAARVEVVHAELWRAILQTLRGALIGLALGIAAGLPLGILIGTSNAVFRSTRLILEFLRATPAPALLPIVILVLGSGVETQVLLVTFGTFFPVLLQTTYGVRDLDPLAFETARAFQISRWKFFWAVKLPAALPFAFIGIRLAVSIALLVAVAVEVLAWSTGLGAAINDAATSIRPATMYVYIVAAGLLGVGINSITGLVQRRLLNYTPAARTE